MTKEGMDAVHAVRPFRDHGRYHTNLCEPFRDDGILQRVLGEGCRDDGILQRVLGEGWRGAGTDALHAGHPFFLARSHKRDPGEGFVQVTLFRKRQNVSSK